MKDKVKK